MSDFYAPSFSAEEKELRKKKRDFSDVDDEIEVIRFAIRRKLLARERYAQQKKDSMNQQAFDFGGSFGIEIFSDEVVNLKGKDTSVKRNTKFLHDYGEKTLRGLFISLKDLMYVKLEFLKHEGGDREAAERNIEELIKSVKEINIKNVPN